MSWAGQAEYLAVLAGCLLITLPLELVLGARVYARPRQVLMALLPVVLVFSVWDVLGIVRGHWTYSPTQTTGLLVPVIDMPIEELAFFVVVPLCALLTYEAVGTVLGLARRRREGES